MKIIKLGIFGLGCDNFTVWSLGGSRLAKLFTRYCPVIDKWIEIITSSVAKHIGTSDRLIGYTNR